MHRIFLLSPAHCGGERARLVLRSRAEFDLARRLRSPDGAPLGELFAFLSGLYFRGKLAYARRFATPPPGLPGILVVVAGRGLVEPEEMVTAPGLRALARVPVDSSCGRYRRPLAAAAEALAAAIANSAPEPPVELVLLGSIATGKYVNVLDSPLGERLVFPADFVGRGDMSRGGLLLRAADEGRELRYVPVRGAIRRGTRPPRLAPRSPLKP